MSHQAQRMHVKALIKLKEEEALIEKSLEYFFNKMTSIPDIVQNATQECKYLSDERNRIESSLRNTIFEVDAGFDTVKSIVNQLHSDENIDVDSCQRKMRELLEKIEQFNVASELEILMKQQKELDDILIEFKVNLPKYERNSSANESKISKSASRTKEIDEDIGNYDEISDFHSLVVKTGHTQNWIEKDHIHFLNVRKKCQNIPALVMEIQKRCPDLSAEKIVNHEAWYKIYLNLREKQRKSVNEWRKHKELEKERKMKAIKDTEVGKIEMRCEKNSGGENCYIGTDKISKAPSPSKLNGKVSDERKEMIKQWKIQKENSKIADEERMRQQSEALHARKEKQFLMRAIEIHDAVAKYKQRKDEIASKLISNPNMENIKIMKSSALLKSLRKKDEEFLSKRKNLIEMKYQKSMKNNCHIVVTNRCPRPVEQSTLMKPTIIWNEKCKQEICPNQCPKPILYIKDLPKLALNNWQNQTSLSFV